MRQFGCKRLLGMVEKLGLGDDDPIEAKILSNSIENAQKQLEDQNFARRKNVLEYDDVMNQQRTVIYGQRMEVLSGADIKDKIVKMIYDFIESNVNSVCTSENPSEWNLGELKSAMPAILVVPEDWDFDSDKKSSLTKEYLIQILEERADDAYAEKEKLFGDKMREVERIVLLRNVDSEWMDHIDAMDELKGSVGLNAYAQRNPINEYRIEGADMFDAMIEEIRNKTVRMILSVVPRQEIRRVEVAHATSEGFAGGASAQRPAASAQRPMNAPQRPASGGQRNAPPKAMPSQPIVNAKKKVGRNDPCPCGSGKKYKKCCGANLNDDEPGGDK